MKINNKIKINDKIKIKNLQKEMTRAENRAQTILAEAPLKNPNKFSSR